MKKLLLLIPLFTGFLTAIAQHEYLTPLPYNHLQHGQALPYKDADRHKYLVDSDTIIVATDTLSLPFIDDFSTNRLRSYKWLQNNITNTFYNVFGTCLGVEGVKTVRGRFMEDTAWVYSFDTLTKTVDSFPKPSIQFTFFGPSPAGCFKQTPQPFTYWPEFYLYNFDSAGNVIDSVLADGPGYASDSLNYAPVLFFAAAEPGTLWFDNYAYVNTTYPKLPPSFGVATLDGLNEYGLPYNNNSSLSYGDADRLTSKPINLGGLTEGDSLYLSFFFEAKGFGEAPDLSDSLVVEFKDDAGFWRTEWARPGYTNAAACPDVFEQVMVKVPALAPPYSYYHNNFQFRFRNKASLYGNLDHWHIDYVRLDKARSAVDTVIQDIAFIQTLPSVLKNYTQMPADQFTGNADLRDSIYFAVRNLDPANPTTVPITKQADVAYPTTAVVMNPPAQNFNIVDFNLDQTLSPSVEYTLPALTSDSIVINTLAYLGTTSGIKTNDTLRQTQVLSTHMAYDDGSAETAYGITGTQTKKFAYRFYLNQPDTLVGFQIMYAQVSDKVTDLIFNINIWDTIRTLDFGFTDQPVATLDNRKPYYVDSVNGFTTYKLDSPLVFTDKVYIGWAQNDTRSLQVGYDLNTDLGRKNMFIYRNARWEPSTLSTPGSPMIRLIFDTNYGGLSTGVENETTQPVLSLYPNPAAQTVFIAGNQGPVQVQLYNTMGALVNTLSGVTQSFDVSTLTPGVYTAVLTGNNNKPDYLRFVKTGN